MSDPRQPWDRHPEETPPAFAAFQAYLHQGAGRSVTKVAEECSKSRSLMNRWSSRHRWRARSEAWDAYLSSQYRAEVIDAQRTLAHRHLRISRAALEKVAAAVEAVDVSGLTVPELVRLWDIATRTEREALQMPLRLEVSGPGGSAVQVAGMTDEERLSRLIAVRREIDERINERQRAHDHDEPPDDDQDDTEEPAEPDDEPADVPWWLNVHTDDPEHGNEQEQDR